ncbi:MAG TPA: conjugal transfer protein TraC, partial [Candidatus Binatia bacterium]|nr:conjugal transfer protein TraC [Candidatus Binatia bacterium]
MGLFTTKNNNDSRLQIQKQLLEAEKEYKSGLNTLRDLIAPSALKINQNSVEISGKYARTFFVLSYPRYISVNWLSPIISMDSPMDMSMFIYPMDTEDIMKKLRNKVGRLESDMAMNEEKGNVRDPMLETALGDIETLRDKLQQGTEHYFRFSLYFTVYADNEKDLEKTSASLESLLGAKLVISKQSILQMEQGFKS